MRQYWWIVLGLSWHILTSAAYFISRYRGYFSAADGVAEVVVAVACRGCDL